LITPVVSIGIPTFNRAKFLSQAIQSVLNQTFQDFEIIVSDDQSGDETENVVRGFGDPRIRYYRTATRLGVPRNWNVCARLASGKYFGLLPDDDVYLPEFLSSMVSALEQANEPLGFAMAGVYTIDDVLRPLAETCVHPVPAIFKGVEAARLQLEWLACVPVCLLFRREKMCQLGFWREDYWDDWAFIIRMAYHFGFAFVPRMLAGNRAHTAALCQELGRQGRDEVQDLINQTFDVFGSMLPATPDVLALRATRNRELSHACVLKTGRALLGRRWSEAAWQFRRARSLHAFAGIDPGFVRLFRKHRNFARMQANWLAGHRLNDTPVISL
jgi:glycosyltransferase involved in cell wall biosynthesis